MVEKIDGFPIYTLPSEMGQLILDRISTNDRLRLYVASRRVKLWMDSMDFIVPKERHFEVKNFRTVRADQIKAAKEESSLINTLRKLTSRLMENKFDIVLVMLLTLIISVPVISGLMHGDESGQPILDDATSLKILGVIIVLLIVLIVGAQYRKSLKEKIDRPLVNHNYGTFFKISPSFEARSHQSDIEQGDVEQNNLSKIQLLNTN